MSIKSFLQLILLLLIFLIISAIYFVYFYSGPLKNYSFLSQTLNKIYKIKIDEENISEQDLLEDVIISKQDDANNKKDELKSQNILKNEQIKNDTAKNFDNKSTNEDNKLEKKDPEKVKNLTKEIEYITSNKDGDIFKILAKYGQTNIDNTDILDLNEVDGLISSIKRSKIYIKSDYAKYDYNNQSSKFYGNVKINYDNKEITCDNLDLNIKNNIAVAYNNVIMTEENSQMKAENVIMDLVTKDININSKNKLELSKN